MATMFILGAVTGAVVAVATYLLHRRWHARSARIIATATTGMMPIQEFVDGGWLQEANRQFFHPRGLALAVSYDDNGNCTLYGIYDSRNDPEGFSYGFEPSLEKALNVERERHRITTRKESLGYVVQPVKVPAGSSEDVYALIGNINRQP